MTGSWYELEEMFEEASMWDIFVATILAGLLLWIKFEIWIKRRLGIIE